MKIVATSFALALLLRASGLHAQPFWERIPGPNGTFNVVSLAEDVAGGKFYAGTPSGGGVYLSTNQGASWAPRATGLPVNTQVNDIIVLQNGTVLAISGAIYRSTNSGNSWEPIAGSPANMTNLHLTAAGTLFAGSEVAAGGEGIYRSTDGGGTWVQTRSGLPTYVIGPITYVRSVSSVTSDGSGNLYATVNSGNANTEVGVYKSVNNGDSWTRMSSGLLANTNVKPVMVAGGIIYVGVRNRVYKSTDGASSWTQTDSIPIASSLLIRHLVQNSSGEIFASTTGGTFRAAAGGTGWTSIANPYGSAQDFMVASNGAYFTAGLDAWGTSGGIQKSTDNGATWLAANDGINNTLTLALTVTPTGGIFNGLGGGRVDYSHDNGATFTRAFLPYTGQFALAALAAIRGKAPDIIVAGTGEGIHMSSNNGASWTKTSTAPGRAITLDLAANFIVGGGGGVQRSTNNGQTWNSLGGGGDVYSLLVTNTGTILAGTYNSGINRTTNGGTNWTNSGTTLFGNVTIGKFVQLPSSNIYVHTLGGMFRSTDDGASWAAVAGTPVGVQYRTLTSAGGTLLLGTPSGLYMSTNEGGSWTNHATGLLNTFLDYLSLAPDGRLYGAGGAGIYRTVNPIVTGVQHFSNDIPGEFRLEQNYPNPFNPTTKVKFQIPNLKPQTVSLKVYDILGREVRTLVNENLQPGSYEVTFDASGLSSGAYLYRLTAGGFTQTKRMVLMR
jgi:hypothetical protein